ncbi:hypothetical protein F66182_5081 [Fusarium sp. NRRL 66182]|nr:hypothetical protein F66182_5081 [Fusarium sp. NRRL 66182]
MASLENAQSDSIFRKYSSKQAADYAKGRLEYPEALINLIINHHQSNNGQDGTLVDVGCGPGNATRMLAPHFDTVYGADPGESMINAAQELGGSTRSGASIKFIPSAAESIDEIEGIPHGSVDMITVATAAHWFDMPKFWTAAAKLLKSGGTVAIWTHCRHLDSFGKGTEVQAIFDDFRKELAPYTAAASHLAHDGYVDLMMPWDDHSSADLYHRQSFVRHELTAEHGSKTTKGEQGDYSNKNSQTLDDKLQKLKKLVNTLGSVNRWQEAHPDLVGTKDDCVTILMDKVQKAVQNAGESIDLSDLASRLTIALLLVSRK